jgi:hypothetical protein
LDLEIEKYKESIAKSDGKIMDLIVFIFVNIRIKMNSCKYFIMNKKKKILSKIKKLNI